MSSDEPIPVPVPCPPGRTIIRATGPGRALAMTVPTGEVCARLASLAAALSPDLRPDTTWEAETP